MIVQLDKDNLPVMLPMGPGVDWKETVKGIADVLRMDKDDLSGWTTMLRICGAIHRANAEDKSLETYLGLMGRLYDGASALYVVVEKANG